jgi:hypothetical protein
MKRIALPLSLAALIMTVVPARADVVALPTPPSTISASTNTVQESNFYNLNLATFPIPGAASLITAVSGNSIFIGDRTTRTIYRASLVNQQLVLDRTITVPAPITLFHKSNAIIDMLATKTNLFVVAVDGATTYPVCGAAKIYEYLLSNLDAKPKLIFTSSPCVRGELFWDARLAINGKMLYIAGGNSLVDYASGIFPGADSQDYIEGDKFPKTNYFGAVSSIDLASGKIATLATGLRHLGGLYYDAATKTLWEDENGPRGGDEVNIIVKGKNYGWPQVTLGRSYDVESVPGGVKPNTTGTSTAPVYGWTPSISPSTMKQIPATGEFAKYWAGDLIVGSLKGHELRRLRISKQNTVMYDEPIPIGDRIRSLDVLSDGKLILSTDDGTLIIVSKTSVLPTGRYPPGS